VNFNNFIRQLAYVTDVFEMPGKDDHGEGADAEVLAEVEEGCTATPVLYAKNLAGDALRFPDVIASLADRKAVGEGDGREEPEEQENCRLQLQAANRP